MSAARYDVTGIGNAIVDVITQSSDKFLIENKIEKGAMTLIDTRRAEELYSKMGAGTESSGGSAANTIAGIASFGGKAAYIGKVADDQLGKAFAHDIKAIGVHYATLPLKHGEPTARCLIMVTPDAQRSMNTFLGASSLLSIKDVDAALVKESQVTFLEGYLFDPVEAKQAFYEAAGIAHEAGRKVALTLSDKFCVDRHRKDFQHLIETEVDILFANESEIVSLYETQGFDEAVHILRGKCEIAAVTRSEKGSVVLKGKDFHIIDPDKVRVVDTTGAGDLYAGGFLFGYAQGFDLVKAGRLGSLAASEVISHFGARPMASLKELARSKGLI
ncbi:MAG: adenosine kinase [Alphaproteobacteria bacterium]